MGGLRTLCLHFPLLLAACAVSQPFAVPGLPWEPELYLCARPPAPPEIDGKLDDAAWQNASWTADFVDIEGALRPGPRYRTRVKMVWDETHLYVGAELEEPHVWATLEERDSVIYQDNDFEFFVDPDGDTHRYFELEINAFGTVWDLLLEKPYRDGGPARTKWMMRGLKTAVFVDGTINDPSDIDSGWNVEMAVPWSALDRAAPRPGERWRINFSRVQWRARVKKDRYEKVVDHSREPWARADNWVWSPQGLVNMHYPERWGIVQFGARPDEKVELLEEDRARMHLYGIYYRQRRWKREKGTYFSRPEIVATGDGFFATVTLRDGRRLAIREDGLPWWRSAE
ncbi:MAG: carbohydrate-binding family 9-like protein [Planctomycetota bacterium]